jgi:hypothetical protein
MKYVAKRWHSLQTYVHRTSYAHESQPPSNHPFLLGFRFNGRLIRQGAHILNSQRIHLLNHILVFIMLQRAKHVFAFRQPHLALSAPASPAPSASPTLDAVRVFELVSIFVEAAVLADAHLVRDEYVCKSSLDDGPEDGHGGAHDGEVDLETGEDDGYRWPPCEVDVGIGCGFVGDDGVEAPYGSQYDADRFSIRDLTEPHETSSVQKTYYCLLATKDRRELTLPRTRRRRPGPRYYSSADSAP